jgi:5,10-methylenetetrahydromethanopterin reductase
MTDAQTMDGRPDISLRLDGAMRPADCIALAKVADETGLTGIWFAENAFARGILPTAAACAAATSRLQINAGVFNPFSRHPTMMAMEIGALDEISQGRASLSIGAGIIEAAAKIGFTADKPLPVLRDTLAIVRGLLRGETVAHPGRSFCAREVKLDFAPRAGIPIFLAGRGDLTVKLAGEAADGLIISNMCSLEFAKRIAELMHASHREAGRTDSVKVIRYMPCAIAENRVDAVNKAKCAIGKMLPGFWRLGQKLRSAKEGLMAGTGITEVEFATAVARLEAGEGATRVLDERYVAAFALAGTPDECSVAACQYRAAGVSELALTFSSTTAGKDIRRLAGALFGNHDTR